MAVHMMDNDHSLHPCTPLFKSPKHTYQAPTLSHDHHTNQSTINTYPINHYHAHNMRIHIFIDTQSYINIKNTHLLPDVVQPSHHRAAIPSASPPATPSTHASTSRRPHHTQDNYGHNARDHKIVHATTLKQTQSQQHQQQQQQSQTQKNTNSNN